MKVSQENKQQALLKSVDSQKIVIKGIDTEDKIDIERKEAYIEPKTRTLLRTLLQCCEKEEINPCYNPQLGFVYKIINQTNASEEISQDFLENLARLSILEKDFYDSISVCPKCQSTTITLHNRCPKCKSHNVAKTSLTEHIPCGCIDQRGNYVDDRCPKCGELLVEGQYRSMGRWYTCGNCKEKFENPEYDLICQNCKSNFTIKEAHVKEIPKFKLNAQRVKEIRQNVASLEDIRVVLEKLGFSIAMPGLATGEKSGMQHHFSLMATRYIDQKQITIALDHAVSETEVQTSPMILYIYKTSEVKADILVFVAMPKLSETAKKIAQGHQILLVEGLTDNPEIIKQIQAEIEDRIRQLTGLKTKEVEPKAEQKKSFFKKAKSVLTVKQES